MLEAGANKRLTSLHLSVLQGDVMAVGRLLADGTNPDEADGYRCRPPHFAVPLAGLEVVSALLDAGANVDVRTASGATSLHLAASQSTVPVVSALLESGADPNSKEDVAGWTPLHYAADWQGAELLPVVSALLQAGADPGPTTQGFAALHGIMRNPEVTVSVVDALLKAGADPMARDEDGDTPLHWAANWTEDVAIIDALGGRRR